MPYKLIFKKFIDGMPHDLKIVWDSIPHYKKQDILTRTILWGDDSEEGISRFWNSRKTLVTEKNIRLTKLKLLLQ